MGQRDEREDRALEALIVSRLRSGCSDENDLESLAALTKEEQAQLECLKPGFIERLIARISSSTEVEEAEKELDEENCTEPHELVGGMWRAEDHTETEEMRQKRESVREKIKEKRNARRNNESS
jgi:hypothetical protein